MFSRLITKDHLRAMFALVLIVILGVGFQGALDVQAATFTWTQSNWSSGTDGGSTVASTTKSTWYKYSSVSNIAPGASSFTLATTSNSTSGALDNTGATANTTVSAGSVSLTQSVANIAQKMVAAGTYSLFALDTNGTLYGWGKNGNGEIGDGTVTERDYPVGIDTTTGLSTATTTSSDSSGSSALHTLAVDPSGHVWAWGDNSVGELGDNKTCGTSCKSPVEVKDAAGTGYLSNIVTVVAGNKFSLAVDSSGHVWAWGYGSSGQLGIGGTVEQDLPAEVSDAAGTGYLSNIVGVAAGAYEGYALDSSGHVWAWGSGGHGALGQGSTTSSYIPVEVKDSTGTGFLSNIKQVSAGLYYAEALDTLGNVWGWGWDNATYYQLGHSAGIDQQLPGYVNTGAQSDPSGHLSNIVKISAGNYSTAALDSSGHVWTWGYNNAGQLGDGTTTSRPAPVEVKDSTGTSVLGNVSGISEGFYNGLAVLTNGSVWSWGGYTYGGLGDNKTTVPSTNMPVQVYGTGGAGTTLDLIGTTSYYASGTYTSAVVDVGQNVGLNTVSFTDTLPSGTSITMAVRAGDSTNTADGTWTAWSTGLTSGASIASLGTHRYVQFKATLNASADRSQTPILNSVTLAANIYQSTGTLTSSIFNSGDATSAMAPISVATSTEPSGTNVQWQVRTAATSGGVSSATWEGPDGTSGTYFTSSKTALPAGLTDGSGDQYFQYKVILTSDSSHINAPVVTGVTAQYAINVPPDFDTTYGGTGASATQNANGTVTITYKVRDTDGDSGSVHPDKIAPSFYYSTNNGSTFTSIPGADIVDTNVTAGLEAVNQTTYTTYSVTWNASSTLSGYYANAMVKVQADDGEAANHLGFANSQAFALDVSAPTSASMIVSASTTPARITISATDNSSVSAQVGITTCSGSWYPLTSGAVTITSLSPSAGASICGKVEDAYGNVTTIPAVTVPSTPQNPIVQDISSVSGNRYGLFLSWDAMPAGTIYDVYRATSASGPWQRIKQETDYQVNYYADTSVTANTPYYYVITAADASGDESPVSTMVNGNPNGTQDAGEGGGGTAAATPPTISSLTSSAANQSANIAWSTDQLTDATVGYCDGGASGSASACSDFTTDQISMPTFSTSHSVYVGGLTPDHTYFYMATSANASSNTATSTGSFTTNSGPLISDVSAIQVTPISAQVTWNTTSATSTDGVVRYATSTANLAGGTYATASWPSNGHSGTAPLAGLTKGTTYYYYVKSSDGTNTGYDYNVANGVENYFNFTTPNDITPPVISDIASSTKRTSATITWTTDEPADSKVVYGATNAYGSHVEDTNTMTLTHSQTVTGLDPNTLYHFAVVSADYAGNTATSSDATFKTEQFDVSNVKATTVNTTSTDITWDTNEPASSQVVYSTFSDLSSPTATAVNSSLDSSHIVHLTGLGQGTTYYYEASSTDSTGTNVKSEVYQFTTGDTTPPNITATSTSSITDSAAIIKWTTDEPASSIVQYGTNINSLDKYTILDHTLTTEHIMSLANLASSTKYYYVVASADGNGNWATSTASTAASFTTLEQQIPISEQTVTTVVQNGGGVSRGLYNDLQDSNNQLTTELAALQAKYDNLDKQYQDLTSQVIGIASSSPSLSPTDIINVVIQKFADLTQTLGSNISIQEAQKLEQSIKPIYSSLNDIAQLVPPPQLQTQPKVDVTSTGATVSWSTDKPATSVVLYAPKDKYDPKDPTTLATRAEDDKTKYATDHSVTLEGLLPGTDYAYRIESTSQAGAVTKSDVFTFTTKTALPDITNATANRVDNTTVDVSWDTAIDANAIVVYTPYKADGTLDTQNAQSQGDPSFGKHHDVKIQNLSTATKYQFALTSADPFGNEVTKKLDPFTTSADVTPPVISNIRTDKSVFPGDTTRAQVIIYWDTDEPSTSQVFYAEGGATSASTTLSQYTAPDNELTLHHTVVITTWTPGSIYRFQAHSADASGNMAKSDIFTILTPKQKGTVIDLIVNNFFKSFGWAQGGGGSGSSN